MAAAFDPELAYVPLEEIDPFYQNIQVPFKYLFKENVTKLGHIYVTIYYSMMVYFLLNTLKLVVLYNYEILRRFLLSRHYLYK